MFSIQKERSILTGCSIHHNSPLQLDIEPIHSNQPHFKTCHKNHIKVIPFQTTSSRCDYSSITQFTAKQKQPTTNPINHEELQDKQKGKSAPFGSTQHRFKIIQKTTPGVGSYNPSISLTRNKSQYPVFNLEEQKVKIREEPGPGFYDINIRNSKIIGPKYIEQSHQQKISQQNKSMFKNKCLYLQTIKQREIQKQQKIKDLQKKSYNPQKLQRFQLKQQTSKYLINQASEVKNWYQNRPNKSQCFKNSSIVSDMNDHAYQSYIPINQNPPPGQYQIHKQKVKLKLSPIFLSTSQRTVFSNKINYQNGFQRPNYEQFALKSHNHNLNEKWI